MLPHGYPYYHRHQIALVPWRGYGAQLAYEYRACLFWRCAWWSHECLAHPRFLYAQTGANYAVPFEFGAYQADYHHRGCDIFAAPKLWQRYVYAIHRRRAPLLDGRHRHQMVMSHLYRPIYCRLDDALFALSDALQALSSTPLASRIFLASAAALRSDFLGRALNRAILLGRPSTWPTARPYQGYPPLQNSLPWRGQTYQSDAHLWPYRGESADTYPRDWQR